MSNNSEIINELYIRLNKVIYDIIKIEYTKILYIGLTYNVEISINNCLYEQLSILINNIIKSNSSASLSTNFRSYYSLWIEKVIDNIIGNLKIGIKSLIDMEDIYLYTIDEMTNMICKNIKYILDKDIEQLSKHI